MLDKKKQAQECVQQQATGDAEFNVQWNQRAQKQKGQPGQHAAATENIGRRHQKERARFSRYQLPAGTVNRLGVVHGRQFAGGFVILWHVRVP